MKRAEVERNIRAILKASYSVEARIDVIEKALAKEGWLQFVDRPQLEALAAVNQVCPACGHRRSKDG